MRVRAFASLAGLLLTSAAGLGQTAPTPAEATVSFHFEHVGMAVPVYTFTVHESGATEYQAGDTARTVRLAPEFAAHLFAEVKGNGGFRGGCNSKARNLADTGTKTLTFAPVGGPPTSCTYNFSDSKTVTELTDTFLGMEFTLEAGQKLEHDHRFDRLGLDEEMRYLVEAAKDGRATGLSMIAPALHSLVNDMALIERVRTSAGKLLEMASLGK